jgi:hypothetical protein
MSLRSLALPVAAALGLVAAPAAAAQAPGGPVLHGRAVLPADATWPAPWPAVPNTRPQPVPDATQPVGGFSALLRAGGGAYWAMPDNGFGSRANSASFILRIYKVRPNFETAAGGAGTVAVEDVVQLRDPDGFVPWDITTEGTPERLLTGADIDPESLRIGPRRELWLGDEFGPFLLHADRSGRVLEPPIPLPYVASPDNPLVPPGFTPNLARSNGFEALVQSPDRRTLHPILEGPVATDPDPLRRWVFEYDVRRGAYTPFRAQYRVAQAGNLVSDATALDRRRIVVMERDNGQGAAAGFKKVFLVDLAETGPDGFLVKREVADLLALPDPAGISLPGREGDIGLGNPFAMPYQTIESVLPLGGGRLAIVNDTNFGSRGRNPQLPDYSDFILVDVPALAGGEVRRAARRAAARPGAVRRRAG